MKDSIADGVKVVKKRSTIEELKGLPDRVAYLESVVVRLEKAMAGNGLAGGDVSALALLRELFHDWPAAAPVTAVYVAAYNYLEGIDEEAFRQALEAEAEEVGDGK